LNHTSADSQLLEWNPRFFVHTQQKPEDETGYYHYKSDRHGEFWIRHGGYLDNEKRVYWDDTLQLDISNPDTRRMLGQITCEIVRCYGPHGLRFDAVENMVHEQWMRCWGEDGGQKRQLPKEELLAEIVHEVKARYPTVTCIAEAYKWWDKMSEMGFDLIYGLEDMSREVAVQHRGWQASLVSRDPSRIREALRRAEFLHWQEGGADMVTFWGHQDKEAPWRIFGENWKWGAAALTILKPGPLNFYASSEAVFESPDSDGDKKVLSFNHPVTIDWSGTAAPFGKFQRGLLAYYRKLERELGSQLHFHVLEPKDPAETWVGYVIREMNAGSDARKVIVVANPADTATKVSIHRPDLQIRDFSRELGPCGEKGVRIFEFKPGK
jgi:hypothetical protein